MSHHIRVSKGLPLSVVIVLALITLVSIPLHADTAIFYIGPQPGSIPSVNNEAVGPYPGQLTDTSSNPGVVSLIQQYLCLDGNITTYWDSTLYGTESAPDTQAEDEAAFLASLLLYEADQNGVTLNSYGAPTPDSSYTQAFMNAYSGPISFAVWDQGITDTPTGNAEPAGTQTFVTLAQSVYTNIFTNTASPLYQQGQTFLGEVSVFIPTTGYQIPGGGTQNPNQSFITAISDDGFIGSVMAPEPGTLGLLAGGLLLAGLSRKRFAGRR
jgi:hypothetical protein